MRLIDADTLRDELFVDYFDSDDWGFISRHIDDAPTVDAVERKSGRWIDETFKPNAPVFHPYKCDQCGEHNDVPSDYCPNCGADMRTKETDRDYERAVEQLEHDMLYEPTYNQDDGSM